MALQAVYALATIFTLVKIETVEAILRSPDNMTVHAVFAIDAPVNKIAVATVEAHVAVLRVLT